MTAAWSASCSVMTAGQTVGDAALVNSVQTSHLAEPD